MVDVDRAGIRRSHRALGGEGTNVLLLKAVGRYDGDALDAALPADLGDSPANGGWFEGPTGWLLLVEGLDEQVDPWIDDLATRLQGAGVEGTLTGAGVVGQPAWAQTLALDGTLSGLLGYRPQPEPESHDGWLGSREALRAAVDLGTGWLAAHQARVMAIVDLRAQFWVTSDLASELVTAEASRTGRALAAGYHEARREVRHAGLASPATASLSSRSDVQPWPEVVEELRSALVATLLDEVSVALISHRDWGTLLRSTMPGSELYHGRAYLWHPERWDEFVLEPCGIQILTDQHLAAAADLSGWRTTRLDAGHVLVEARDLEPWFGTPLRPDDALPADLLDQARHDFGAMILTPQRAEALGLDSRPPRPSR